MSVIINEFDGFRVEVNSEENRGDIILSRPPLNVIQYSVRKVKTLSDQIFPGQNSFPHNKETVFL